MTGSCGLSVKRTKRRRSTRIDILVLPCYTRILYNERVLRMDTNIWMIIYIYILRYVNAYVILLHNIIMVFRIVMYIVVR